MVSRGVIRHANFDDTVSRLAESLPSLPAVIDGLLWTLAKKPDLGVYNQRVGVWQARFWASDNSPEFLLFYTFGPRLLFALTVVPARQGDP